MSQLGTDPGELTAALSRHGIDVPAEQIVLLDRFRAALWAWNEKLNLTRHTDFEKFVGRDVVDSRAFEPYLEPGQRVLDVGTGGGVPGMVLAILRPDLHLTLSESVAKRAKAAAEIAQQAGLPVVVRHARAEALLENETFDSLVARAVAPLSKLLRWLDGYWHAVGQLLLVKGPAWVDERQAARQAGLLDGLELRRLCSYPLPGTSSESVVLRIRPGA